MSDPGMFDEVSNHGGKDGRREPGGAAAGTGRGSRAASLLLLGVLLTTTSAAAAGQAPATPAAPPQAPAAPASQAYEPQSGQEGKDVVWVPSPDALVEAMLDIAKVTAADRVIDLGSGDGRTVIAAAKRGATAHGIEYNPEMVALSQQRAAEAGVSARATFEKADLFETDLSKATVITMFLLPSINMELRPTLLELAPGTRIVSNTFTMEDWEADDRATVGDDCSSWCTALLWIVPARVAGTWQMAGDTLTLTQQFQKLTGTLGSTPISDGALRGDNITFRVGDRIYTGRVSDNAMTGTVGSQQWAARRP